MNQKSFLCKYFLSFSNPNNGSTSGHQQLRICLLSYTYNLSHTHWETKGQLHSTAKVKIFLLNPSCKLQTPVQQLPFMGMFQNSRYVCGVRRTLTEQRGKCRTLYPVFIAHFGLLIMKTFVKCQVSRVLGCILGCILDKVRWIILGKAIEGTLAKGERALTAAAQWLGTHLHHPLGLYKQKSITIICLQIGSFATQASSLTFTHIF